MPLALIGSKSRHKIPPAATLFQRGERGDLQGLPKHAMSILLPGTMGPMAHRIVIFILKGRNALVNGNLMLTESLKVIDLGKKHAVY
jgi:hypothetical protein